MKLIKTKLCSSLKDTSLSHLMTIAIESPDKLTDSDLDEIVEVWNRKKEEFQLKKMTLKVVLLVLLCRVLFIL